MVVSIEPTGAALGASVTGVDLSKQMSREQISAIYDAWMAHQVLIFPGQAVTENDQLRFTRYFGDLPRRKRYFKRLEKGTADDSVMFVTNIRENGQPIGTLPDGEMMFHSDGAYDADPYKFTMLYAIELPSHGGDTLFADMYRAFDTLPQHLKEKLHGRNAVHGYYAGSVVKGVNHGAYSGEVDHPIFIRHPDTGRTAIFASRLMTVAIEGLPQSESNTLLEELFAHMEAPENVYRHKWTLNDFVIWDNRCTIHARTDFPHVERRLLRRTVVQGIRPQMAA